MYKVEYLSLALHDVTGIVSYIAGDLQNPRAAEKLAQEFMAAGDGLQSMPYRRRVYQTIRPLAHEYRALRVEKYLMFYWIDEDVQVVTVARVIYRGASIASKLAPVS